MDSIEDYNPDQPENDKRYWELAKRVYNLRKRLLKPINPIKVVKLMWGVTQTQLMV